MKTIPLPLLLALLTGATATAQDPAAKRPPPPPMPPMLAMFDTDHDGVITAAEIQQAATVLAKLDRNGDGKITADEMRPPPPAKPNKADGAEQGPPPQPGAEPPDDADDAPQPGMPPKPGGPPHGPPPPVIAALDADHNGVVSKEELKNAGTNLLKIDRNNDGELSIRELLDIGPPPPGPGGEPPADPQDEPPVDP